MFAPKPPNEGVPVAAANPDVDPNDGVVALVPKGVPYPEKELPVGVGWVEEPKPMLPPGLKDEEPKPGPPVVVVVPVVPPKLPKEGVFCWAAAVPKGPAGVRVEKGPAPLLPAADVVPKADCPKGLVPSAVGLIPPKGEAKDEDCWFCCCGCCC